MPIFYFDHIRSRKFLQNLTRNHENEAFHRCSHRFCSRLWRKCHGCRKAADRARSRRIRKLPGLGSRRRQAAEGWLQGNHRRSAGPPGQSGRPYKVSLDLYRDVVVKALGTTKQPAVVVGHSFGGIVISAAAEKAPRKIKTLVYLAAYLPKNGDSLVSMAQQDKDAKIGPHLQIQKDKGIASIEYSARADLFANGGPEGLRKAIPNEIIDEPPAPLATPVKLTAARFGKVDKAYIHTALDQVISPRLPGADGRRYSGAGSSTTLQTGHTPFLTDPDDLATDIEKAAK